MKRVLLCLMFVAAICVACDNDNNETKSQFEVTFTTLAATPDPDPTPDPEPNPEVPENPEPDPKPDDAISTLEGDIEVVFPDECSLAYADCFGDYYSTGSYMWGFYFMNFTSKEQIYIEIMHPVHDLIIPEGTLQGWNHTGGIHALRRHPPIKQQMGPSITDSPTFVMPRALLDTESKLATKAIGGDNSNFAIFHSATTAKIVPMRIGRAT